MKKIINSIVVLVFALFVAGTSKSFSQNRLQTREFLHRTHRVIEFAKESVARGKVYTGDLTRAVYHQRYARDLFHEGKFRQAIHHSYRARELAIIAIRANKGEVDRDMDFHDNEREYGRGRPDGAVLDAEIKIPGGTDDKVVIKEKDEEVKDR